jgi:hypothetical protein
MSFEEWIDDVFDRAISKEGWWWELPDDEVRELPSIGHLTRLSAESGDWSRRFSDEQLGQGLWFIFHDINDNLLALYDAKVPLGDRIDCILTIPQLYFGPFASCASRLDSPPDQSPWELNETCFMLWDIAEFHNPWRDQILDRSLDEACLSAMRSILSIPRIACQESALHGLNHWRARYPARVSSVIDEFLARGHGLTPSLAEYARLAREGKAQ